MKTIKSKILFSLIITSIITIILLWIFISYRLSGYLEKISEDRVKDFSKQLIHYLVSDSTGNYNEEYNKISSYSTLGEIRITLIDLSGKVCFDSEMPLDQIKNMENHLDREEIINAQKYRKGIAKRYSHTLQKDMIYYAETFEKPLILGGINNIYFVRTAIPIIGISKLNAEIKFIFAVGCIISFIIVLILSFTLSKFISKPLNTLKDIAIDLNQGIYKSRFKIEGNDEISFISKTLSDLGEKINEQKIKSGKSD
jgi:two-component system, OmpR family, phosphate regulon sensor histidine kinase PhoR